ncbi:hypothetical protein ATANTOWER_025674 [Ataeniobius toweri]|uniref:Peptidase M16 N-terminal domain-containing protein n=1 Tax=Ataeniobius toweri TaxID=208326 RepID=A0ABU7ATE7_9TELE|nr:hypothetical protein [Ataeniobius toweri]
MAAAALCIGVGSFSDPDDLPGLAHFLEHSIHTPPGSSEGLLWDVVLRLQGESPGLDPHQLSVTQLCGGLVMSYSSGSGVQSQVKFIYIAFSATRHSKLCT